MLFEYRLNGNSILVEKEDNELMEVFAMRVKYFVDNDGEGSVGESKKYAMEKVYGCRYIKTSVCCD